MALTGCQVMAKPTGSVCNIDCTYCFYLEKEALYPERNKNWRMSDETLENYIRQHIAAQSSDAVTFAWQGGEPTMMGLPFFHRVVELCDKYANGKKIEHALQTNGILIDDEWARFFAEQGFLVGLSIDGPAHLHNQYRVNRAGKGTHEKVVAAMALLKSHNVEFNTLTVVGKHNVDHAREVYDFLLAAGSRYMQFIPLVERMSSDASAPLQLVLPGRARRGWRPGRYPPGSSASFLTKFSISGCVATSIASMCRCLTSPWRRGPASRQCCAYIQPPAATLLRWNRTAICITAITMFTRSTGWAIFISRASGN